MKISPLLENGVSLADKQAPRIFLGKELAHDGPRSPTPANATTPQRRMGATTICPSNIQRTCAGRDRTFSTSSSMLFTAACKRLPEPCRSSPPEVILKRSRGSSCPTTKGYSRESSGYLTRGLNISMETHWPNWPISGAHEANHSAVLASHKPRDRSLIQCSTGTDKTRRSSISLPQPKSILGPDPSSSFP